MDIRNSPFIKKPNPKKEISSSLPKTLNLTKRKTNAEKIVNENFSFAKRLAQPFFFISTIFFYLFCLI